MMKKILVSFALIISVIILTGCNKYKNISEEKALELGVSLFEKYFDEDVYSSGINFENEQDKYGLYLKKTDNSFELKNIFSEYKKNYVYNDGIVTIFNETENIVDNFMISESDFLKKYAGFISLDINKKNFSNHQTAVIEKNYSKGSRKYYILEQKITFRDIIEINVLLLNEKHTFYVNNVNFEIENNQITDIYFDGFQKRENEKVNIRYFVYKL